LPSSSQRGLAFLTAASRALRRARSSTTRAFSRVSGPSARSPLSSRMPAQAAAAAAAAAAVAAAARQPWLVHSPAKVRGLYTVAQGKCPSHKSAPAAQAIHTLAHRLPRGSGSRIECSCMTLIRACCLQDLEFKVCVNMLLQMYRSCLVAVGDAAQLLKSPQSSTAASQLEG
jgi:hypothetical protein